jgi:hypothetical protein
MRLAQERMLALKLEILRGIMWHEESFGEPASMGKLRREGDRSWKYALLLMRRSGHVVVDRTIWPISWAVTPEGREWYKTMSAVYHETIRRVK